MTLHSRQKIENACQIVYEAMAPTAQYCWPLLGERAGCEVWLKHENHGPLGAFKMRSALVYFRRLREMGGAPRVAVTATRGNFGQAVACAALGMKTEIVGVVSAHARAYYDSFARREVVVSPARTRLADGMAVPTPDARAVELMCAHVSRMVMVTDDEVAAAMRAVFDDTHN